MDMEVSRFTLKENDGCGDNTCSPTKANFVKTLSENLFPSNENSNGANSGNAIGDSNSRVLSFSNKAPAPRASYHNELRIAYSSNKSVRTKVKRSTRHIPSAPERILDAQNIFALFGVHSIRVWNAPNASGTHIIHMFVTHRTCLGRTGHVYEKHSTCMASTRDAARTNRTCIRRTKRGEFRKPTEEAHF